jgi:hypothetical protein
MPFATALTPITDGFPVLIIATTLLAVGRYAQIFTASAWIAFTLSAVLVVELQPVKKASRINAASERMGGFLWGGGSAIDAR